MKKIIQTFPTVMLEAIIDNEEDRIIISFNINTGKENYKFPNL